MDHATGAVVEDLHEGGRREVLVVLDGELEEVSRQALDSSICFMQDTQHELPDDGGTLLPDGFGEVKVEGCPVLVALLIMQFPNQNKQTFHHRTEPYIPQMMIQSR